MTDYEIQRMNTCLENNSYMRRLGLRVGAAPFASYGQDEHNLEPNKDDNLEPEKDCSLEELDTTISKTFVDEVLFIPYYHVSICAFLVNCI